MTADISSNESTLPEASDAESGATKSGAGIAGIFVLAAAVLFVVGLAVASLGALQLVVPGLLSGIAFTSYGRLVPAAGILISDGWLPIAGLGLSYWAVGEITGAGIKRRPIALSALALIALGSVAGFGSVLTGSSTGIAGLEGPVWTRAIAAVGFVLAAIAVTATAKHKRDNLGAAGWYLTAASWWLAASGVIGLIPLMTGTMGTIQSAFASNGVHRLFAMTMAVGLVYFALSRISGADPSEPRPLAALGFWSLTLTWAFMGGVELIYSATPDWYETLTVSFAIGALVPVLVIVTDIGLLLKGRVADIDDRASLRYSMVSGLGLIGAVVVSLLLAWRATSGVVQYSTWTNGLDLIIVLGGASFAVFAANSVRTGGGASGPGLSLIHI